MRAKRRWLGWLAAGWWILPAAAGWSQDWARYQGDAGRNQYSELSQITRDNIPKLSVAWRYRTGDRGGQIQCNPLVIDGVLYGTTPSLALIALDAATGTLRWRFEPPPGPGGGAHVNRGVMTWVDGEERRILYAAGTFLYAVHATTGQAVITFGDGGRVSLKTGLGERARNLWVTATTPGAIYRDLVIMGTRVAEDLPAAPGFVQAFDARTGRLRWVFHTIPQPGEFGYDTWPTDAYQRIGGANCWAGMSLDEERGLLFVPTGSASFDFYGGNRKGANLFANCLIALDAATGERRWHFQTVHHDLWDRDLPAPPNLVTVRHNGLEIPAVSQTTKSGHVFLFHRETGEPLFPIEERPVPSSDLAGEKAWPTQPFPTRPPPFSGRRLTPENVSRVTTSTYRQVTAKLATLRSGADFIPPSREGTVIYPGFDGGAEWGGAAFDPERGLLVVNANEMAWILTMEPVGDPVEDLGESVYLTTCSMCHGRDLKGDPTGTFPSLIGVAERKTPAELRTHIEQGKGMMPGLKHLGEEQIEAVIRYVSGMVTTGEAPREPDPYRVPYLHTGYIRWLDDQGYPVMQPPWGTLNAIDLNRGELVWQVPLGEFPQLTARGISKTGTENYGGPVVTAGGLVFIGASKDERFRAFDVDTGEELWSAPLPAGGYATPSVYEVDGRQFVVIACGGAKMGTPAGDSYVAFALPAE